MADQIRLIKKYPNRRLYDTQTSSYITLADVKEFSTGSFGWYLNGKIVVNVDGKPCSVQVGMNLTVVGSKEAG